MDCFGGGGCTAPSPFENNGSTCNMGGQGGGCETDSVCQDGLSCSNVFSLLGIVVLNTCGECTSDVDCMMGQICAPIVDVSAFTGARTCIYPHTLPQDAFCDLDGNGNGACQSGICSIVDVMGLAEVGACGECNSDADCISGVCMLGSFDLGMGVLAGSVCQA